MAGITNTKRKTKSCGSGTSPDSRRERTAHNLIRERDIKFPVAVNAEYVLVRHMAGSEVNNVNLLLRLTVWAFNRHHDEARLSRHAFPFRLWAQCDSESLHRMIFVLQPCGNSYQTLLRLGPTR